MEFPIWKKRYEEVDIEKSKKIIDRICRLSDINASNVRDWNTGFDNITPLISICLLDEKNIVEAFVLINYLLEKGADINKKNVEVEEEAVSPLSSVRNYFVLEFLLNKPGIKANEPNDKTLLHCIHISKTDNKYIGLVKKLIEKGASTTTINHICQTPLTLATQLEEPYRSDIVIMLLQHGANPNGPTKEQLESNPIHSDVYPVDELIKNKPLPYHLLRALVSTKGFKETSSLKTFKDKNLLKTLDFLKKRDDISTMNYDQLIFLEFLYKDDKPIQSMIQKMKVNLVKDLPFPQDVSRLTTEFLIRPKKTRKVKKVKKSRKSR